MLGHKGVQHTSHQAARRCSMDKERGEEPQETSSIRPSPRRQRTRLGKRRLPSRAESQSLAFRIDSHVLRRLYIAPWGSDVVEGGTFYRVFQVGLKGGCTKRRARRDKGGTSRWSC
jgi:hypothetical protein